MLLSFILDYYADLVVARLQVRIDETTDEVDELKEKELVLGGDEERRTSAQQR